MILMTKYLKFLGIGVCLLASAFIAVNMSPNVIGQNNTSENNTTGIISSNLTGAQSSLEAVNDTSAVNYAENQSAK